MEEEEGAAEAVDMAMVVVVIIHITEEEEVEDADEGAVAGTVLLLHYPHPLTGLLSIGTVPMRNGMPLNGGNVREYKT